MLQKTSGIILKTTKYSENSLIVKAYTEQFGIQSYIVNGIRSKNSKNRIAAFQPLSVVVLEVINSEKKTIHRISEINIQHNFYNISSNIIKSSISIFMNEILYKSLKEEYSDPDLYQFIVNALNVLDSSKENCANFPILFLLELSRFLGFYPQGDYNDLLCFFDLQEGQFVKLEPLHPHYLKSDFADILHQFLKCDFENYYFVLIDNDSRRKVLNIIIEFYTLHVHGFNEIKSHKILEEIIS